MEWGAQLGGDALDWPWRLLPEQWAVPLRGMVDPAAMAGLHRFLQGEQARGATIYPSPENLFAALRHTAPQDVRAVILGQDPYHGPGQAHGLSFSVPEGVRVPSSLANIFKELASDLGAARPAHGSLLGWAGQGVLLLNTVLTVAEGAPQSHRARGWEQFTAAVLRLVQDRAPHVVFMLWGKPAQALGGGIDQTRHRLLCSSHPSGLSAYRGFIGSRPFSQANDFLLAHGLGEIDWAAGC